MLSLIRATSPNILHGKIAQVVSDTVICESKGETYNGLRKNREHKRPYLNQPESGNEKMICGRIGTELRLNHTALLLNTELRRDGLTEIGVSCLRISFKIRKVPMGTNDAYFPQANASFNIYKQLATYINQLNPRETIDL